MTTWKALRGNLRPIALEGLWALALVSLPITSFPLISRLSGGTQVSPVITLPLALLAILVLLPHLLRKKRMPSLFLPLMLFVTVAIVASAASLYLDLRPSHRNYVFSREVRALVTLLTGVVIYAVVATFPSSEKSLARSLRYLYFGAVVTMLWATIQAYFLLRALEFPAWMEQMHSLVSIRDLHYSRVVGLAYEPSWLSNQLVLVYLPLWVASVAKGYSVMRLRFGILTLELGLALWGLVVHFLTFSRIGLVSVFVILGYMAIAMTNRLVSRVAEASNKPILRRATARWKPSRSSVRLLIWLVLLMFLVAGSSTVVLLGSRLDPRFERAFGTNFAELIAVSKHPVIELAKRFEFGERVVYWTSGMRVFGMHPTLGTGLGVSGFYFAETIPSPGYRMPEIIRIVAGPPELPNVKSLWIRILAETGVAGFVPFLVWLVLLFLGARKLERRDNRELGVIGMAAAMALLAQVWEGLSLDSFAMAQLWILPALVTASLTIASRMRRVEGTA